MIEVVQAFDRTPFTRLDGDERAALDRKIEAGRRLFANRGAWLKTHQRGIFGIPWTMREMTEPKMIVFKT